MSEPDRLVVELQTLRQDCGCETERRARMVLAEVVRWLRVTGHGDVRLSAHDHTLGIKLRIDSVVTVGGDQNK